MASPYELLNRRKKAERLAVAIRKLGGDGPSAAKLSESEWKQVAKVAAVNAPSAETVKVVIEILEAL